MALEPRGNRNMAKANRVQKSDPILLKIQASRKTREAFYAACSKDPHAYLDGPASTVMASYDAVARTAPRTLEGLLAKLAFIGEVKARTPDAFDDGVVVSMAATAAKRFVD